MDQLVPVLAEHVRLDDDGAALLAVRHPADPERVHLLDLGRDGWHSPEHRWGSGAIVTDRGSGRWNVPRLVAGPAAVHQPIPGVVLTVTRRFDAAGLRERFVWRNVGDRPLTVRTLGVTTPFRDVYDDAATALRSGVHAHVWTGGTDSWVLSQPTDGGGPVLVLRVVDGSLAAYSVESRNQYSSSNVRGHIVLHVVDQRAPHMLGGQPQVVIPGGGEIALEWVLAWAATRADAAAVVRTSGAADRLTAETGSWVDLGDASDDVRVLDGAARLRRIDGRVRISSAVHGVTTVETRGARRGYFFHAPVAELARARVRFILERQRPRERDAVGAAAFVPFDTRSGLTQLTSGWPDWSDGAERIGMPALLQAAVREGWAGDDAGDAVRDWIEFAADRLLDDSGAPRWGSRTFVETPRLYNAPWLVRVLVAQAVRDDDERLLRLARRTSDRADELGAQHHLSIGRPESLRELADALAAFGDHDAAAQQRARLHASADHFAALGTALPAHEVNYEQSMVAPLVSLLALSLRDREDATVRAALERAVVWLDAFGGPQPHARLRDVAIRHWDGYWFGADRRWGDVFPHHWSVLSAVAWDQLPDDLRAPRLASIEQVFRANLSSFHVDGSATCAFVFPSAVDGAPAHVEDPLVNDQDWALALLLDSRWWREQR